MRSIFVAYWRDLHKNVNFQNEYIDILLKFFVKYITILVQHMRE